VDGAPAVGTQPTTVVIGSAVIKARDEVPTSGQYLLWYATDNPVLWAKYQRLGFPVSRIQPDTEFSLEETTNPRWHWNIAGAGLDYRLDAIGNTSTQSPAAPSGNFYFDGPRGDLHLAFTNTATVSPATINADFTQLQPFQALPTGDQFLCIPAKTPPCSEDARGAGFNIVRGSWTSDLTLSPHTSLD
jgi:hypothetical protein